MEKHGVSFHEAQYVFADTQRVINRFFCFGMAKGGIMTVRFTGEKA
jgi:uncharacterized DUF497 family protein